MLENKDELEKFIDWFVVVNDRVPDLTNQYDLERYEEFRKSGKISDIQLLINMHEGSC